MRLLSHLLACLMYVTIVVLQATNNLLSCGKRNIYRRNRAFFRQKPFNRNISKNKILWSKIPKKQF